MTPELKEILIDSAWGLARYVSIIPTTGFILMRAVIQLKESLTGDVIYKKMTRKRKISCWFASSNLVFVAAIIYRWLSSPS
jgi:hypothetical protein